MVIGVVSKLNLGCYTVSLSSKPANLEGIENPDAMYFIIVYRMLIQSFTLKLTLYVEWQSLPCICLYNFVSRGMAKFFPRGV